MNYLRQNSQVLPSCAPLITPRFFISNITRRIYTGLALSNFATFEAVVVGRLKISSIADNTTSSVNCFTYFESFVLSMTYYLRFMYLYLLSHAQHSIGKCLNNPYRI